MTIKRALFSLRDALETLARMVREVAVAVDDAGESDLAVLDALRNHAAELEGEIAETAESLQLAIAAEERGDAPAAARALAATHERFTALGRRLRFGLSGHDTLFAIGRLPSRRGAQWRGWSEIVLRQLQQVDDALHNADAAFVTSWQEIAEVALHAPTHRKGFPADPDALGGYLRQLRDSCHIDMNTVCCGIEGEQSVTRFNTLVGLTSIFARAWLDARNDQTPSRYFAVNVHEVHQHLFGVVSTLERLRRAVAPEEWVTAEIPSKPPITAATLWDWMHRYCASTALEMLRHGCDGKAAVHDRMNKFDELVSALIQGPDSPCGLRAFHDDDVQELIKDLQCHVQKVRDATRKAAAY